MQSINTANTIPTKIVTRFMPYNASSRYHHGILPLLVVYHNLVHLSKPFILSDQIREPDALKHAYSPSFVNNTKKPADHRSAGLITHTV
jgi:hypothetical protein